MKDTDAVKVRNRNNGSTGYVLDGGFHRTFESKEEKTIPFSELRQLQYAPGGQYILDNYLVIEDEEAIKALSMKVEPEYFYSEEDVKKILFEGSIDAFADFLDFAPSGALEIAKDLAIKEKIPDVRKRDMLTEKTGVNISNAIMVNNIMDADDEKTTEEAPKRRVPIKKDTETASKERRVDTPAPKIVIKK